MFAACRKRRVSLRVTLDWGSPRSTWRCVYTASQTVSSEPLFLILLSFIHSAGGYYTTLWRTCGYMYVRRRTVALFTFSFSMSYMCLTSIVCFCHLYSYTSSRHSNDEHHSAGMDRQSPLAALPLGKLTYSYMTVLSYMYSYICAHTQSDENLSSAVNLITKLLGPQHVFVLF